MISVESLPSLNALLNSLSATFIISGFIMIRRKNILWHKRCMLSAVFTSTLFLISYLFYHYLFGSTKYTGEGFVRFIYFTILISHTVLAALVPPFVLVTLIKAFQGKIQQHIKIARFTFVIWLYVSITGVTIYFMLYHFS